jgi:hypothetical protein
VEVSGGGVSADDLEGAELLPVGTKDGPPTQAALDAKLGSLAQVIDAQQPDVLALQEVGPPQMLQQLQERLTRKLAHQQISEHPDRRQIRVAFLGRLPLQDPVQLHPFPAGLAPVQVGDPPADQACHRPWTTWPWWLAGHRHRWRAGPGHHHRPFEVQAADLPQRSVPTPRRG